MKVVRKVRTLPLQRVQIYLASLCLGDKGDSGTAVCSQFSAISPLETFNGSKCRDLMDYRATGTKETAGIKENEVREVSKVNNNARGSLNEVFCQRSRFLRRPWHYGVGLMYENALYKNRNSSVNSLGSARGLLSEGPGSA